MQGRGFLFFKFFYYFFRNFLARVEYERNSGLKFFSLFFVVSHPVLAKKIAGKKFYNFSTFVNIFFRIFLPGSSVNGIRDKNFFFFSFSAYLIPVLAKKNPGKRFFLFLIFFCYFFRNFLARVEYKRNSGLKFFSLFFVVSHPVLAKKISGKKFYNFSTFFNIFFEFSCPGRV